MIDIANLSIYGFKKEGAELPAELKQYEGKPIEMKKALKALASEEREKIEKKLREIADTDDIELVKDQIVRADAPKPISKYYLIYESPHMPIEPIYFFCLNTLKNLGFPWIEKITDIFAATEHSSFWGAAAQRISLTQEKAATYLQLIGRFVKEDLFKLVRELRWLDERIFYHQQAREGVSSAEITLKSIWTDLVDGRVAPGAERAAANIFQLATQAGFTTLPDWFFSTNPKSFNEIDKMVDALPTTAPVKSVLKNKLTQYLTWKEYNYKELLQRKNFSLKYLKQQYEIIRLYLTWLKPYLRQIERMQMDVTKVTLPELVAAFEGSIVEIEILGSKLPEGNKTIWSNILISFEYRTKPSLHFVAEPAVHRGPIHVGESRIIFRAYAWDKDKALAFKNYKESEDLELLSSIDSSIKATLEALGEDLYRYLGEEEKPIEKAEEVKPLKPIKQPTIFEPFSALIGIFKKPEKPKVSPPAKEKERLENEKERAKKEAKKSLFALYKAFKKNFGLASW